MTESTPQSPIGSGFTAATTAAEVVTNFDFGGNSVVVTGGYSGLGFEVVKALHSAGASVLVPARRPKEARNVLDAGGLEDVEVDELDLADLDCVSAFADRYLASGRRLDVLVNNAAVMAAPLTRVGDGWESQFATNHLGHFALTNRLWPRLGEAPASRVVELSSSGHKLSPIRFDDLHFASDADYDKWVAYGQAKTANSLFAAGWMDDAGTVNERFKSTEQGAATTVWAATSVALDGLGGVYLEDVDVALPTEIGSPEARIRGVDAHAIDRDAAARLWAVSAELTGLNVFA